MALICPCMSILYILIYIIYILYIYDGVRLTGLLRIVGVDLEGTKALQSQAIRLSEILDEAAELQTGLTG